jgi:hypothetical protein
MTEGRVWKIYRETRSLMESYAFLGGTGKEEIYVSQIGKYGFQVRINASLCLLMKQGILLQYGRVPILDYLLDETSGI